MTDLAEPQPPSPRPPRPPSLTHMDAFLQMHLAVLNDAGELDHTGRPLGFEGANSLGTALKGDTRVVSLKLRASQIGASGAAALALALKRNSAVTSINFAENELFKTGAVAIAKALTFNTNLLRLDVADNVIEDEGALAFGRLLLHNTTLQSLSLAGNRIRIEGLRGIADALLVNRSLLALDLSNNQIGSEGAALLADLIRRPTCRLAWLSLSHNGIGSGFTHVAEALNFNTSLQHLNLSNNQMGDDVAIQLAFALRTHASMTYVGLGRCNIGTKGASQLIEVGIRRSGLHIDLRTQGSLRQRLLLLMLGSPNNTPDLLLSEPELAMVDKRSAETCVRKFRDGSYFEFHRSGLARDRKRPTLVKGLYHPAAVARSVQSQLLTSLLGFLPIADVALSLAVCFVRFVPTADWWWFGLSIAITFVYLVSSTLLARHAGRNDVAFWQLLSMGGFLESTAALLLGPDKVTTLDVGVDVHVLPMVGERVTVQLSLFEAVLHALPQSILLACVGLRSGFHPLLGAALATSAVALCVSLTLRDRALVRENATARGQDLDSHLHSHWARAVWRIALERCTHVLAHLAFYGIIGAAYSAWILVPFLVQLLFTTTVYWWIDQGHVPDPSPMALLKAWYICMFGPGTELTRTTWLPPRALEAEAKSWITLAAFRFLCYCGAVAIVWLVPPIMPVDPLTYFIGKLVFSGAVPLWVYCSKSTLMALFAGASVLVV